ncbi:PREDICTED: tRNA (guanine(37)-N1)-methyltransferase [Ceratosolen solmsi marchali]|uniref:tRNA (guanine(37)-N1)-methyltransferase n=1 Tax=Ceratosolen solmsi marchali TaxID=326594 RepID=A0AAJ6YEQ2_9HYME|nr:PREDICTED: tRNA (guanine(37)-N1)-methyltransferase [Ceratosolen solmsi marchali]
MIGSRIVQLNIHLSKVQFNFYHQTSMASLLVPPTSIRGKNSLDYEAFNITLKNIPCVVLADQYLRQFINKLRPFFLKFRSFKSVQSLETIDGQYIVYLDPRKIKNVTDVLKKEILWNKLYKEVELKLSYINWQPHEVLNAILPEDIEVPTSFSQVGHIIHLNLRNEQLPYKNVIGQVYLDKIPNVKTVVNKVNIIDNVYRNFAMEILAGEQNTMVSVKENGCIYHFDFSKVYWNPRLGTEHFALVNFMKKGDVLYDIFAGVGPFAVPSARKGIRVLANDLNPESYKWLVKNAQVNKVTDLLMAFNKDGREFLKVDVKKDIVERREKNDNGSEHIVMNLPALAVEFLDVFENWLSSEEIDKVCLNPPVVHVYCFIKASKSDDFYALAKLYIEKKLGYNLPSESLLNIHQVRNIASNKEMMRVSFLLTKNMLKEEPAMKKLKHVNDNDDDNFLGNNGEEQEQDKECI